MKKKYIKPMALVHKPRLILCDATASVFEDPVGPAEDENLGSKYRSISDDFDSEGFTDRSLWDDLL